MTTKPGFEETRKKQMKEILLRDSISITTFNRMIDIAREMDELWKYHPNNPICINVQKKYNDLLLELRELDDINEKYIQDSVK